MAGKILMWVVAAVLSAAVGVTVDRYIAYDMTLTAAIIVSCAALAIGSFLVGLWREHSFGVAIAIFIMVAPVTTAILFAVSSRPGIPPAEVHGSITSPSTATHLETYTDQAPELAVRGTLKGVPTHAHTWLALEHGNGYWPLSPEISPSQGEWQRDVSIDVPSEHRFNLVILLVDSDDAQRRVEAWVSRPETDPLPTTIGIKLASVNDLVVSRPCISSPARCLLVPRTTPLPQELLYQTKATVFSAKLSQEAGCRRTDGAYGLDIRWAMSGKDYGGWGLKWSDTGGHFDADGFANLTLWVKGGAGGERMQIGIRDTKGKELKVESQSVTRIRGGEWSKVSVPLSSYPGIDLSSIDNVNIGFNSLHGSGQMCLDEIRFE